MGTAKTTQFIKFPAKDRHGVHAEDVGDPVRNKRKAPLGIDLPDPIRYQTGYILQTFFQHGNALPTGARRHGPLEGVRLVSGMLGLSHGRMHPIPCPKYSPGSRRRNASVRSSASPPPRSHDHRSSRRAVASLRCHGSVRAGPAASGPGSMRSSPCRRQLPDRQRPMPHRQGHRQRAWQGSR